MSDQTLVDHASPTLAGLKTGALFPVHYPDEQSMREDIRRYNRRMQTAGLRLLPVRYRDGRALLYLYRGKDLDRDLGQEKSRRILASAGYTGTHASFPIAEAVAMLVAAFLLKRTRVQKIEPMTNWGRNQTQSAK